MAGRPPKKGIDYAGWSVDIFDNDTKIDKLLDSRGWEGFGIYFYLCQRAYGGEGYFYKWSYDDCASTSRKMGCGISAGTVRETVGYCLHIGLFDKGLFDRQGILTSRGIQRRYWEVIKARDVRTVISDYWLLQDHECKGLIKLPQNMNLSDGNANFPAGNSNNNEGNANFPTQKESKVKQSNKSFVATPDEPEQATVDFTEDSFEIRCVDILIDSCLKTFPNSKVPRTLQEKQKWAIEIERMKRLDGRSEADIMQALNYAITDTFWQGNIRSTKKFREKFETLIVRCRGKTKGNNNKFNQFQQNNYDFDSLEKELLSN